MYHTSHSTDGRTGLCLLKTDPPSIAKGARVRVLVWCVAPAPVIVNSFRLSKVSSFLALACEPGPT